MNVLVLTHRLPFAPNRGDRVRAFHMIRHLRDRTAAVHVLSLVHDAAEAAEADTLRRQGIGVSTALVPRLRNLVRGAAALGTNAALTHVLLDSPDIRRAIAEAVERARPDVVLAYCSGIARFALEPPLDRLPLVIDFVDVDSAKWAAFAETASPAKRWIFRREARCLAAFEARVAVRAYAASVVNQRERLALVSLAPGADVHVVPNGIDLAHLAPEGGPAEEPVVVFPAVFNYAPNAEGAVWLARRVWPRVVEAVPRARLILAGSSPTRAVRALADADGTIEVTGAVPDMRPFLWSAAIAVAPLFLARGVQNKVLEAAAAGLPCVVTEPVWHGLPPEVLPACRAANTAEDFAHAVVELLRLPPIARRRLAAQAQLRALQWHHCLAPLPGLLENAVASGAARPQARMPAAAYSRPLPQSAP